MRGRGPHAPHATAQRTRHRTARRCSGTFERLLAGFSRMGSMHVSPACVGTLRMSMCAAHTTTTCSISPHFLLHLSHSRYSSLQLVCACLQWLQSISWVSFVLGQHAVRCGCRTCAWPPGHASMQSDSGFDDSATAGSPAAFGCGCLVCSCPPSVARRVGCSRHCFFVQT